MRIETLLIGALSLTLAGYLTQASAQPITPDAVIEKPITTQAHAEVHYRVAVLANYGVAKSIERWQPLMDYLSQNVANASFEVVPLNFVRMNEQLLNGQVQFVVTNPGHYFNMSDDFPISWLATMKSDKHQGNTFAIGATIVVRKDSQFYTIDDLMSHSVVASDPNALGGYQAAIGLLQDKGFPTYNFFSKVTFLGFPLEPLIYQVRDSNADIAITPFCTLEQMIEEGYIKADDFRVINDVTPAGYDCAVSTPLYPNWSFASSDDVPLVVRTDITRALLSISATHPVSIIGQNRGWAAPISQFKVIKLFKDLDLESNKVPIYLQVWLWIKLNQQWAFGFVALFIVATIYHLWLEYRFRQESENLLHSERQLKIKALQLERLQSAAILGEIGAGLAHELNQPIAAITQYSEGGMIEQAKSIGINSIQYQLLEKIQQQSIRAGEIVHRIRSLLQRKDAENTEFDVQEQLTTCIELLEHELKSHNITLSYTPADTEIKIIGDKVGFLPSADKCFKNAVDAMPKKHHCSPQINRILINLQVVNQTLKLAIYDNGTGLSCSADEFKTTFFTTKENGLGLGLAICHDVITQFGGNISLSKCVDDTEAPWVAGCRVSIVIPLITIL